MPESLENVKELFKENFMKFLNGKTRFKLYELKL